MCSYCGVAIPSDSGQVSTKDECDVVRISDLKSQSLLIQGRFQLEDEEINTPEPKWPWESQSLLIQGRFQPGGYGDFYLRHGRRRNPF